MTRQAARRTHSYLLFSFLLLAAIFSQPVWPVAQESGPKRDAWQRPAEVMDALGIRPGSIVADVGCGSGYFTFHLAVRVGPQGKVYAEDIDDKELAKIRRKAKKEGLTQIETLEGASDDPSLPAASVDVVLVVNSYHEWRHYDAMLQGIYRALKPGGLLGLIDGVDDSGKSRSTYYEHHRMPEEVEREDATRNGFRFVCKEPGFTRSEEKKEFYFLIFEKPENQEHPRLRPAFPAGAVARKVIRSELTPGDNMLLV